jgi:hypothetical protein
MRFVWTDWRGKEQIREINTVINTDDFVGAPGHALLLIAANRHLSGFDLWRLLFTWDIQRSSSWIHRRRWLFQQPGTVNSRGRTNGDGKDARAVTIMRDNRTLSVRNLTRLLAENGIKRGKDWVRQHRCD